MLDTADYVTPDNVIDIIEEFNRQSAKAGVNEGIMEYLDNEWGGASRDQMNEIVDALISKAAQIGIPEDNETVAFLTTLKDQDAGFGGDYAEDVAKQIDDAMKKLIEYIKYPPQPEGKEE